MGRPKGCECDWHSYMVGDGCRYCNPQKYIDLLEAQSRDYEIENECLQRDMERRETECARMRTVCNAARYVHDTTGYSAATNAIIPPHPDALRELTKALKAYRKVT